MSGTSRKKKRKKDAVQQWSIWSRLASESLVVDKISAIFLFECAVPYSCSATGVKWPKNFSRRPSLYSQRSRRHIDRLINKFRN